MVKAGTVEEGAGPEIGEAAEGPAHSGHLSRALGSGLRSGERKRCPGRRRPSTGEMGVP